MSEQTQARLNGAQRAALFLMSLGEDEAASVLRHLGAREVQSLGAAMSGLKNVAREQAETAVHDFVRKVGEHASFATGSAEYIRKLMVKALGEERAEGIIDRVGAGAGPRGLEQLEWLDPGAVAEMIAAEHPQIVATVLASLDPGQAAQVLADLPESVRHEAVMRVASLEAIPPEAVEELHAMMERQQTGKQRLKPAPIGGVQAAARILNSLDPSIEVPLMEQIGSVDQELAGRIQESMFVFEDLIKVDDRGIQALLREVNTENLVIALKGADETVREKILRNLSKRAAEMLQDDLEAKGPVRVSEVEAAQKDIMAIAKRMSDEGQIALGGGSGEFV